MNNIGILCASDTELAPFLTKIQNPQITEKAMLKFYAGTIEQVCVVAVYSGVCKVNAAIAAQILIDVFHVSLIINAGVAGGLKESVHFRYGNLAAGDLSRCGGGYFNRLSSVVEIKLFSGRSEITCHS